MRIKWPRLCPFAPLREIGFLIQTAVLAKAQVAKDAKGGGPLTAPPMVDPAHAINTVWSALQLIWVRIASSVQAWNVVHWEDPERLKPIRIPAHLIPIYAPPTEDCTLEAMRTQACANQCMDFKGLLFAHPSVNPPRNIVAFVPRRLRQVCNQERVALLFAARDDEIFPIARPGEIEDAVGEITNFLRLAAGDGLSPQT